MLQVLLSPRLWLVFATGFSSGLPLLLTGSTLQAWMKESSVDLTTIGLFSLVGFPYTVKFLWAPMIDRFAASRFGRRRTWMILTQIALAIAILGLGQADPAQSPWVLALLALLVSFFSASQDIVLDAYRREILADRELGLGSSFFINGYRVAMWVGGAGALVLADQMAWSTVYLIMAILMAGGIVISLFAPEPEVGVRAPQTLREAVIGPFVEYLARPQALLFLAFVLFYKLGDTMASAMTTVFILDIGFTKTELAAIVKTFGIAATLGGGFIGGLILYRIGIYRALWGFGFLQAISTLGFALLASIGHDPAWLAAIIAFENLSAGMGTSAFVAYMASLTNKQFTATQYALLSSVMGVPRVLLSAPTGFFAQELGWFGFFTLCTLLAIPGMILLWFIRARAAND